MKSETRRSKMAELYADDPELQALIKAREEEEARTQEQTNSIQSTSRDAESLLAFLRGDYFTHKVCKNCDGDFLTDYGSVAYCSDACRIEQLRKWGIDWDVTKPLHERWGNRIPLTLGPEMIELAEAALNRLLAIHSQEPEKQMSGGLQDLALIYES